MDHAWLDVAALVGVVISARTDKLHMALLSMLTLLAFNPSSSFTPNEVIVCSHS